MFLVDILYAVMILGSLYRMLLVSSSRTVKKHILYKLGSRLGLISVYLGGLKSHYLGPRHGTKCLEFYRDNDFVSWEASEVLHMRWTVRSSRRWQDSRKPMSVITAISSILPLIYQKPITYVADQCSVYFI